MLALLSSFSEIIYIEREGVREGGREGGRGDGIEGGDGKSTEKFQKLQSEPTFLTSSRIMAHHVKILYVLLTGI